MTIIIDSYVIPEKGKVELNVQRSFEIKITAEEARRQVNRWLHDNVTMLIRAEAPALVVSEQVVWRVPAVFCVPDLGRVGVVGTVDVDVDTGVMTIPSDLGTELERKAEELAERLPPYQPKGPAPALIETLERGLREVKVEQVLNQYSRGGISFGAAAQQAGISQAELARYAHAKGLEPPFSDETLAEELS